MKKTICSILKMIVTTLLIFVTPFILPLLLKLFLKLKCFEDVDEFKNIINIFNNFYIIIFIIITIIILLWFFHKWEDIKTIIKNGGFSLNLSKDQISVNMKVAEEVNKSNETIKIMSDMKTENKEVDSKNAVQEVKQQLSLIKQHNKLKEKCKECNREEIESENRNLRFFAAYNIINVETKSLLHSIYNEKYIKADNFKSRIIQGYTKRNKKNIKFSKKDINKIANSKYEAIYEGLKFLNIIEPSEDDKDIKLTNEGKIFVEKYIERKAV